MRYAQAFAFLTVLTLAALSSAKPPATAPASAPPTVVATAPAGWRNYSAGAVAGVQIGISVKQNASLADEQFLILTLNNTTKNSIFLGTGNYYRIDYTSYDLATDKPRKSTSGSIIDMLEGIAPHTTYPELTPGIHQSADYPSAYCAVLLGSTTLPLRTKATLHIAFRIKDGQPTELSCPFEFTWNPLDQAGVAAAQKRLQQLLAHPDSLVQHCNLAGVLLEVPEVAAAVPIKDLLTALDHHRDPFSCRDSIVAYLNTHQAKDPDVHAYYLKALAVPDRDALADLAYHSPALWDDRYIAPLVKSLDSAGHDYQHNAQALNLLDAHPETWADKPEVREALCQHLLKEFPALQGPSEKLTDETSLQFLGITREPTMVPILAPFLSAKKVVRDYKHDSFVAPDAHPTPMRLCDVAYNAIRSCQGRPKDALNIAPVRGGAGLGMPARTDANVADELAQRDRLIEKLQAELK